MSLWLFVFSFAGGPQGASARMQQYLGLADTTLRNPIQPVELESRCRPHSAIRAAIRSRSGLHFVRDRFAAPLLLSERKAR